MWLYPFRCLKVVAKLPKLFGRVFFDLEQLTGRLSQLEAEVRDQPQFEFSFVQSAEPFLDRAEKNIGRTVASMTEEERRKNFYSYFSEICDKDLRDQAILKQHEAYLKFIPQKHAASFLDIGCGAGEFVRFLNENGIEARGIEKDSGEVDRAVARGLKVQRGDALEFLRDSQETFRGISLIELIEHIPFESADLLIQRAISRLAPNGVFIVETINLRHPLAFNAFYTDPTHLRPVSPEYIAFLMQWGGLQDVRIVYTNPAWLPGVSRHDLTRIYFNFAVIGHRK